MDKKVTAPCEACGGLLPLKPIQTRRRVKQQRQRQDKPSKDSHHPQGSTNNCNLSSGELESEAQIPFSDESSGNMRSYDSVLEEIQAIFANQKVKREMISPYIHRDHRHRKANKPKRHERSLAHQHAISQRESDKWPSKSRSSADVNSPHCFLHPHQSRQTNNEPPCKRIVVQNDEPTCKRIVALSDEPTSKRILGQLPQDDASNCSFDPLRISPSPRIHAAQSCIHHLGEHNARGQAQGEATTAGGSSPPEKNSKSYDNHHDTTTCRPKSESPAERNPKPGMDNDYYHDILRRYEQCHIHQIDEHITATLISSPRPRSQRHGGEERSLHPGCSCHQHTVVRHHEGCHLHPRDDPESTAALKCQRCGCPDQRDYPVQNEVSLQEPTVRHHSPKAYVKIERTPEQEVIACAQRISPRSPRCKMHGDCSKQTENVDVCGICCHPKKDHNDKSPEAQNSQDPSPARKEKIQGCHLHGLPRPKCQEPKNANPKCKDPLVWAPRRVRKPKPLCSSVHWLDRVVASQKFPSHIIQQFLQGKRKCPPRLKKPKCPACVAKCLREVLPRDPCECEVAETWNSGSDIADIAVECKQQQRRGKLSRLALSRSLIIKPVVKLSTSQGPWTTRKEFQVCSECRNPLVTNKSGRWKSILEEMSPAAEGENIPKKLCSTKFSCQTIHGLALPSDTAIDLRCPELFSAFRVHSKLQKVQNETFDRRAAMQVAQTEGIELDKELFDQLLPEIKKPNKGSPRRSSRGSPRNYAVCRQQRREVYRDLCKIVDPPVPVCQVQCPPRDVGVQISNTGRPPEDFNLWNPSDFGAEPYLHSDRTVQSSVQPSCTPSVPANWSEQEQPHCREQEKSWDEQHWAYLVEACKQARMEQGVYGSCAACQ